MLTGFFTIVTAVVYAAIVFAFILSFDQLNDFVRKNRRQGVLCLVLFVAMALGCFVAARFLAGGLALLFGILLPLLNAPFDWASLGLTRALLRRGIELMGWWEFLLAIVDALLAAVIIVLLALTIVIGVQIFDHLAEAGGGTPSAIRWWVLLFKGIREHPEASKYWWVYALLLSPMIPSVINLMIGGAFLTRGLPGCPRCFCASCLPASQ